jgi:hypothetical protein
LCKSRSGYGFVQGTAARDLEISFFSRTKGRNKEFFLFHVNFRGEVFIFKDRKNFKTGQSGTVFGGRASFYFSCFLEHTPQDTKVSESLNGVGTKGFSFLRFARFSSFDTKAAG